MLDIGQQSAVKAVLCDLVRGVRVPPQHWANLLGAEPHVVERIANAYPDLRSVDLESADLAIHNALNLYVNGLTISEQEWRNIGVTANAVEVAFEAWQREV